MFFDGEVVNNPSDNFSVEYWIFERKVFNNILMHEKQELLLKEREFDN